MDAHRHDVSFLSPTPLPMSEKEKPGIPTNEQDTKPPGLPMKFDLMNSFSDDRERNGESPRRDISN